MEQIPMIEKKHPNGLYAIFFTGLWERFSYYGMRGFFVLYLTTILMEGGFGLNTLEAYAIYGILNSLVYVTPILGGILADKLLGQRRCIYIGALLMAAGQFVMSMSVKYGVQDALMIDRQFYLYLGLGLLILGNGFFKPNLTSMVGGLYSSTDTNKDGAFTIFYMAINIGALVCNLVIGTLAEKVGWQWGFIGSGIALLLSAICFFFTETLIRNKDTKDAVGMSPHDNPKIKHRLVFSDWVSILLYTGASVATVLGIVYAVMETPGEILDIVEAVLGIAGLAYLLYIIFKNTTGKTEWSRVGVIFVLAVFNIIFWSGFEQAGASFTTFAKESTNLVLGSFTIPASWFASINALFIVILAPVFTILWAKLSANKINPRTPYKFAYSLIFLSLGFVVMGMAHDKAQFGLVSPLWLVMVYFLHTIGELFMSPIGLSMITKLAPVKIASLMMGVWMGSIALGNYLAAAMTKISMALHVPTFYFIAVYAIIAAGLAFAIAPVLNKMMKGIH